MVHYPWHPLAGKSLKILTRVARSNGTFCRCVVVEGKAGIRFEIPAWMFDVAVGSAMCLVASPQVCVEALCALRQVLHDTFPPEQNSPTEVSKPTLLPAEDGQG